MDTGTCRAHESAGVNSRAGFKQQHKKRKMSAEVVARSVRQRSVLNRLRCESANVISNHVQQPDSHTDQGKLQCLFAGA